MTDEQLMRCVTDGDEESLLVLHRRYVNLVYSMAYHVLNDNAQAEEVTQDVFMKLWQSAASYNSLKGQFKSWLLTVTRHAAIDRLRSMQRHAKYQAAAARMDDYTSNRHTLDEHNSLRFALDDLPPEQRIVLELAYFGGMSQTEISAHLDVPLGTIKTRIRLGMDKLRQALVKIE